MEGRGGGGGSRNSLPGLSLTSLHNRFAEGALGDLSISEIFVALDQERVKRGRNLSLGSYLT